ncbi:MAG: hypothetical protein ACM3QZ_14900 [Solirubrobacterales bacterium]
MTLREERQEIEYSLGTYGFLKPGWWVLHLVSAAVVFSLGYLLGRPIFG